LSEYDRGKWKKLSFLSGFIDLEFVLNFKLEIPLSLSLSLSQLMKPGFIALATTYHVPNMPYYSN
jgi:hypothetical protein